VKESRQNSRPGESAVSGAAGELSEAQRAAIALLVSLPSPTYDAVALAVGCSASTLREWRQQPTFREYLIEMQDTADDAVVAEIAEAAREATAELRRLIAHAPDSVRQKACEAAILAWERHLQRRDLRAGARDGRRESDKFRQEIEALENGGPSSLVVKTIRRTNSKPEFPQ
jgi:transposase-like protein